MAKGICRGCPLRADCLAGALSRAEPHGVWGGEELKAGHIVVQCRRRGRPGQAVGSSAFKRYGGPSYPERGGRPGLRDATPAARSQ